MAKRYDAVVIGGGHNGLITAAYLAKAGRRSSVLEKNQILGGAADDRGARPGLPLQRDVATSCRCCAPRSSASCELPKHGLEILPLDGTITPLDGDYLWRVNDHGKTVRELRRWSQNDAEAYEEYGQLMAEMARFIKPILSIVPPDPGKISPREWLPLGRRSRRRSGTCPQKLQTTFIQLMTMCAADFLDQWFETEPLKATMSASGIIGTFQGPRSPGTAYVLLHHYMGEIDGAFRAWGIPKGGTGGISYAIANAALALGVEIRTEAPVANIITRGGRATGVALESGEEIARRRRDVVARLATGPSSSLLEEGILDPDFEADVMRYKYRGFERQGEPGARRPPRAGVQARRGRVAARRDLVLARRSTTWSARTTTRSTASYSERPYIDCIIPTLVDPTMAPPGKHIDELLRAVRAVPPGRRSEWTPERRDAFGENVIDTLEERFPGHPRADRRHSSCSRRRTSRTSPGLTEGNIFQGELSLEQLFFNRPVPGLGALPHAGAATCGCAARPRTPAAASWAPTAASPRSST